MTTPQPAQQNRVAQTQQMTGAPVVDFQADRSAIPINALEYLRVKLVQLTRSLTQLYTTVHKPNLPGWPSLRSQFNIVLKQLISLSETLGQYKDILARSVAYPLPSYPVLTQDNTLKALLRKKATPEVEDWINEGRETAVKNKENNGNKINQDEDFSAFAANAVNQEVRQHNWGGFLTRAQTAAGEVDRGLNLKSKGNDDTSGNSNGGSSGNQQPGGLRGQQPGAPGQPQHAGLPRPEVKLFGDGGWPVERVVAYMSIGVL